MDTLGVSADCQRVFRSIPQYGSCTWPTNYRVPLCPDQYSLAWLGMEIESGIFSSIPVHSRWVTQRDCNLSTSSVDHPQNGLECWPAPGGEDAAMFYLETLRTWVLKPGPPWNCVQDLAEDRVWQLWLGGVGEAMRELGTPVDRNRDLRIHLRKAGRQWEVGPLMSSKFPSHAPLSHWTSPAKHKFKDEIIENFKMVTTEH